MDHKQFLAKMNGVTSKYVFDHSKIGKAHNENLSKNVRTALLQKFEEFLNGNVELQGL